MLNDARALLRKYWHFEDFRSGQGTAIESILSGRDSLTIMPTGGGKSLCYQVPAMLLPGVTIVVSPLISLMKDQVDALEARGLPAAFINSSLSPGEMSSRLEAAERGELKLLYVAPERFDGDGFQERLRRLDVSLLAIDEAHCVSEWGHDFRPSYLRLGGVRQLLGNPPVAALTATATHEVRDDVVRQLKLRDPAILVTGFDRRNLNWHVLSARNDSEKDRLLLRLLRDREGSAVVYASTRKSVDALTALLNGVAIEAVGYHAGLPDTDRKRLQESFMTGEVRVVVATNAFGMGIDKSDVRIVVHYNMPGNLEAYYQEAGRAGRDGNPADCVLLHAYPDRFTHEFFIDQGHPPRSVVEDVMRELRRRVDGDGVFHGSALELSHTVRSAKGDRQVHAALRVLSDAGLARPLPPSGSAVHLRLIARPARIRGELADRTEELALLRRLWRRGGGEATYRGVLLEWNQLGGRSSAAPLLDRLQAGAFLEWAARSGEGIQLLDRDTPIPRLAVDWRGVEARRALQERKLKDVQGYAYDRGCRRGRILRYFGDPGAMDSCGACDNCLGGAGPIAEAASSPPVESRRRTGRAGGKRGSRGAAAPPVSGAADPRLFEALRAVRSDLAREESVPAFCVFPDRTLTELALRRPSSEEEMLEVPGVGPAKLEKYASRFLEALREHAAA